jgi:hypothetical protein
MTIEHKQIVRNTSKRYKVEHYLFLILVSRVGAGRLRPDTMTKIILKQGGWPGVGPHWRGGTITAPPVRQVSTWELINITKAEPIQFDAIINNLAPIYIT